MKDENRQTHRLFRDRVVNNHDVCGNCYRLMFDRVHVPDLITDYRDSAPDSIRHARVKNIDDDRAGLFCECGSDGVTQPDERPRDSETAARHAENVLETLRLLGHDRLDETEFLSEVASLRALSDLTGVEMFTQAIKNVEGIDDERDMDRTDDAVSGPSYSHA